MATKISDQSERVTPLVDDIIDFSITNDLGSSYIASNKVFWSTIQANTGLYGVSGTIPTGVEALLTDTLTFNGSVNDVLHLQDNGRVSMGFNSPTAKFHIQDSVELVTFRVQNTQTAGDGIGMFATVSGVNTNNTALVVSATNGTSSNLAISVSSGTTFLRDTGINQLSSTAAGLLVNQGTNATSRALWTITSGTSGTNYSVFSDATLASSGKNVAGRFHAANGATGNIAIEVTGDIEHVSGNIGFYGSTPVTQAGSITDPTGGGTIDAEARTAIIAILAVIDNATGIGLTA